ncbi:hypothetical protein FRC10_010817 [Ceratobasidium sp. 414]|nr:hypothetical protein FRC10_010817 [Ceratobasidium sp. 414]
MYHSTESDNLRRIGCTPNTRVDVLEQLRNWASDPTSEKVYWLNGMAGTGKTTIAYQSAETRTGSFLVFSLPFRHALSGTLEQNKDLHNQPLQDQFEQLVVVPLQQVAHTFVADITIVIDALDECEDKDGVDRMLGVLLSYASGLSAKFFVAGQPDPKILDRMRSREDEGRRFGFLNRPGFGNLALNRSRDSRPTVLER